MGLFYKYTRRSPRDRFPHSYPERSSLSISVDGFISYRMNNNAYPVFIQHPELFALCDAQLRFRKPFKAGYYLYTKSFYCTSLLAPSSAAIFSTPTPSATSPTCPTLPDFAGISLYVSFILIADLSGFLTIFYKTVPDPLRLKKWVKYTSQAFLSLNHHFIYRYNHFGLPPQGVNSRSYLRQAILC